jgi:hypothetical protein
MVNPNSIAKCCGHLVHFVPTAPAEDHALCGQCPFGVCTIQTIIFLATHPTAPIPMGYRQEDVEWVRPAFQVGFWRTLADLRRDGLNDLHYLSPTVRLRQMGLRFPPSPYWSTQERKENKVSFVFCFVIHPFFPFHIYIYGLIPILSFFHSQDNYMKAARVFGERIHRSAASLRYRLHDRLPILAEAAAVHPVAPVAGPAPAPAAIPNNAADIHVPVIYITDTSSEDEENDVWAD